MDSINKNQPEDNRKDLKGAEGVKKIKELVDKSPVCFFCTDIESGFPFATRPMAVQEVDNEGNFWFLSAIDSHKNEEIKNDSHVQLLFKGSAHSDFLSISGRATISKDKKRIHELWNPMVKTWFTEGEDDPRITVIKVKPSEGWYWDTKHGKVIATVKIMIGALTGVTLDDSVEGKIKVK